MNDYTMFRKALNGFDKEEVLDYIKRLEEDHARAIAELEKKNKHLEKVMEELKSRITMKDDRISKLENDIEKKYQPYIDNYQQIGELIYASKIKGDQILSDAQLQADRMLSDADREANRRVGTAQGEIKARLEDGRKQYQTIRSEMDDVVNMFHQLQRKFVVTYKDMNEIIESMPESLDEFYLGGEDDDLDEGELHIKEVRIPLDDIDLDDEETDA